MTLRVVRGLGITIGSASALGLLMTSLVAQQQPVRFGGDYASLEPRRQQFVDDWTKRFTAVTGQHLARVFSLSSVPNALADAAECAARAQSTSIPDPLPLEYGQAYEMTFRFDTGSGDAPVLRLLWRKEMDSWRITSYRSSFPERNRHRPCPFVSRNVERTKARFVSSRFLTT